MIVALSTVFLLESGVWSFCCKIKGSIASNGMPLLLRDITELFQDRDVAQWQSTAQQT
jgi:hypothetical protein